MPSQTPALKMPYPLGTDPVADGDDAIKALAERIEARMGWGWVTYVQNATTQPTFGTSFVDMAGLTTGAITLTAGRRYRATLRGQWANPSTALHVTQQILLDGGPIGSDSIGVTAGFSTVMTTTGIFVTSAGAHTIKGQGRTSSGTMDLSGAAGAPNYLLLEDLGQNPLT